MKNIKAELEKVQPTFLTYSDIVSQQVEDEQLWNVCNLMKVNMNFNYTASFYTFKESSNLVDINLREIYWLIWEDLLEREPVSWK